MPRQVRCFQECKRLRLVTFTAVLVVFPLICSETSFGQTNVTRIPAAEAATHQLPGTPPSYPSVAEAARIQGDVIVEIRVHANGTATPYRLVMGHPLLAPAAVDWVRTLEYRPFEVDGKPVNVVTDVMVTFGRPSAENRQVSLAEISFQQMFWTAEDSAQDAIEKVNYTTAEQYLQNAEKLLAPVSGGKRHLLERWRWSTSMGQLCQARKKTEEAERYYKKALALNPSSEKNSVEMAATSANLAGLHLDEKRYDLARESARSSLATYEKLLKQSSSGDSSLRDSYAHAIAVNSWILASVALAQNQPAEAIKNCNEVLENRALLVPEKNSMVSFCEGIISAVKHDN